MGGGSTPGPGIWTLAAFLITTSASILPSEAFATYAPLLSPSAPTAAVSPRNDAHPHVPGPLIPVPAQPRLGAP